MSGAIKLPYVKLLGCNSFLKRAEGTFIVRGNRFDKVQEPEVEK